jgi:hypothetical protein
MEEEQEVVTTPEEMAQFEEKMRRYGYLTAQVNAMDKERSPFNGEIKTFMHVKSNRKASWVARIVEKRYQYPLICF